MEHIRKISILLVIASMLGIMAGCGMVQVNPEKDRAQVVAQVDGEEILKGEVLDQLDREKESHNLTDEGLRDKNNREHVMEIKKSILDQLAIQKLLDQKAAAAGFTVTDQLMEETREDLADIKKSIQRQLEEADEENEDEESQEKDYVKEAEDYLDNYLATMGMTQEEYVAFLAEQKCIEKLYDKTVEGIEVSASDIEEFYNEELAKQKENTTFLEGRSVDLFDPPKIRVKHALVEIPGEKVTEYRTLLNDKKEDEAKELLDKELEAIKDKAQKALDKAKKDGDFDEMVGEVNPDSAEEMKEGITIHKENIYLPEEYKEAAFKLKVGGVSDLVATPNGYYIIKLEEKYSEKTYTLEEKRDDIKEILDRQEQDEKWKEVVDDWKEKLVKKFEKRL
ncbi:MAG TPA: peptidyl-prolyl cis-trans isomerase [Clostridia bacterium]|nr:peptidyl-prolyl cis-trans isomerase [Clostridia bacterium]